MGLTGSFCGYRYPLWVISAIFIVVRLLPVFPQFQTCRCTALTDAMCQLRTPTPNAGLFDHLIGEHLH